MRHTFLLAILTVFVTLEATHDLHAGDLTYDFVSYDSLQNGYTLSGSITTDDLTFGLLQSSDILAFTYTISNGTTTVTQDQNSPGAEIFTGGNLIVESGELFIYGSGDFGFNYGLNTNESQLSYTLNEPLGEENYQSVYYAGPGGAPFWNDISNNGNPPLELGGTDEWIIAEAASGSVPEPASLTLSLLGGACVAAFEWTRRRRLGRSRPRGGSTARS